VTEPDRLPSVRELGDRLHEAAIRETRVRRARRRRPWLLLGLAGALVAAAAGGATATGLFTGSGKPIEGEGSQRNAPVQPGVLADSAAADPAPGALPWAIRVFSDANGRECFQLGRLSGGRLGNVENGQFRPFEGNAVGPCGSFDQDPLLMSVQTRPQPAPRTIFYGLSSGRAPVVIRFRGETRRVKPGALGGFVALYEGIRPRHGAVVTTTIDGRTIKRRY
jgi:hypothetical protein